MTKSYQLRPRYSLPIFGPSFPSSDTSIWTSSSVTAIASITNCFCFYHLTCLACGWHLNEFSIDMVFLPLNQHSASNLQICTSTFSTPFIVFRSHNKHNHINTHTQGTDDDNLNKQIEFVAKNGHLEPISLHVNVWCSRVSCLTTCLLCRPQLCLTKNSGARHLKNPKNVLSTA